MAAGLSCLVTQLIACVSDSLGLGGCSIGQAGVAQPSKAAYLTVVMVVLLFWRGDSASTRVAVL